MTPKEKICCAIKDQPSKGIISGIAYGLLPHSFCIAFILFSIIGATLATAFLKKFLLIPYFFHFLVFFSLLSATISSVIYLKKTNCLCVAGIKSKWKYITTLCSTTILINLLLFFVVLPALTNINSKKTDSPENYSAGLSINVQLPCSGHASLIIDELEKNSHVGNVKFTMPSGFEISYDPEKTSPEKIISSEIFRIYPATIIN